jgi:hypothetical protein
MNFNNFEANYLKMSLCEKVLKICITFLLYIINMQKKFHGKI